MTCEHRGILHSIFVILSVVLLHPLEDSLASPEHRTHSRRPKTGLVLAGGGALGMAHVGVLKVLEENRIPVDVITGTSMGSIVGAGYASGATVVEMETILSETNWDTLFDETFKRQNVEYRDKYGRGGQVLGDAKIGIKGGGLARFAGVVRGQSVLPLLQRLYYRTPGKINFDELPIPYRAVAADIETGEPVVIGSGDLARAARASMAVPGFFTPVELDGKSLIDGGIANNLPVDVAQSMGAKRLIVVDLLADLKKKEELGNILGISGQIISLLLQQNSTLQRKNMRSGDILLVPDLKGYSATDFNKAKEIFAKGEAVAREHIDELRAFAVSEEEYAEFKRTREGLPEEAAVITSVSVDSDVPSITKSIAESFEPQVGKPFDARETEAIIAKVHEQRNLAALEYEVQKDDQGNHILALNAQKPTWYDQYLRVGFSLQDNFDGDSAYQLAMGARFNELNAAGGSLETRLDIGWRPLLELDYYQPIAEDSAYFVNPILSLDRYQVPVRINNEEVAEYQRNRIIGGFGAGRKLGKSGEAQVGVRRGNGDFQREIGDPSLPEASYQIGDYFGRVNIDSLDTPDFPTTGVLANFEAGRNVAALGSSDTFTQLVGSFGKPFTFGVNTILLGTDFGTNLESTPATRSFLVGGMFDLSGFQPGALAASDFVINRLIVYRELASLGGAFAKLNLFGGGSMELASLKSDIPSIEDQSDIVAGSIFLGADTPILPIYLAAGTNSEEESSFYLNIGRIFKARR